MQCGKNPLHNPICETSKNHSILFGASVNTNKIIQQKFGNRVDLWNNKIFLIEIQKYKCNSSINLSISHGKHS